MASAQNRSPVDGVIANLRLEGGDVVGGRVSDIADRAVILVRPRGGGAPVPVGKLLTLELAGQLVGEGMSGEGHIVHQVDLGPVTRSTFRFAAPEDFERLLDTELGRCVNRRSSMRIQPPEHAPLQLSVQAEGDATAHPTHAIDVSAGGVSVMLGADVFDVALGARVRLALALPDDEPAPAVLAGFVRCRLEAYGKIRYGIHFDPDTTADFDDQEARVSRWIMRVQRQRIRKVKREAEG